MSDNNYFDKIFKLNQNSESADNNKCLIDEIGYQSKIANNTDKDAVCEECKTVLRIGVFFDGTNNNKFNTELQEKFKDKNVDTYEYGSYGNSHSNIAKLYYMYPNIGTKRVVNGENYIYVKIYIEGVGTVSGDEDAWFLGGALDYSKTSVIEKVRAASLNVYTIADSYVSMKSISRIELDIYGFSRGATAARHYANMVHKIGGIYQFWRDKHLSSLVHYKVVDRENYRILDPETHIKFIGLFDTVATHGITTTSTSKPAITKLPDDIADDLVFQLGAYKEWRKNFPLISILPEGIAPKTPPTKVTTFTNGNFVETYVPGAHADVGGGYYEQPEERVLVENYKGEGINRDATAFALALDRSANPNDPLVMESDVLSGDRAITLHVKRPFVRADLSLVYLKMMYDKSVAHNVPFNHFDNQYQPPKDLISVAEANHLGLPLANDEREAISSGTHNSANIHKIANWPTDDWKRVIYYNQ